MNKIDRRIAYRIVLDTETCPVDKELNEVVPTNMWTYDCGWAVVDKRGKVYKVRSFVNADIFLWALMHEIGHCMTEDMWTDEEREYFNYQKDIIHK